MFHPVFAGPGPGPWALLGPVWFLFWVLLIGGICFLVFRGRRGWGARGGWAPGGPPPIGPDGQPLRPPEPPELALERARAILHERYARGEISTEEYRERIDNLV